MDTSKLSHELQALRAKIDKVDDQIIGLLNERIKIISEVAVLKKKNHEDFFIRASREADMIKALIKKADPQLPKTTVVDIWRKIISLANILEQDLKIAIHNPNKIADYLYLTKEYYNASIGVINHESITRVIDELEKKKVQIGIFALPISDNTEAKSESIGNENWWINLANNKSGIRIFARIPFVEDETGHVLVAAAIKQDEQSASDNTLLYLEADQRFAKAEVVDALKKLKLNARILRAVEFSLVEDMVCYLIELDGFHPEKSLAELTKSEIKPYFKVLGYFATPIQI